MEHKIIKAASEEDLRTMLLNRYSLKLNEMPTTMTGLIRKLKKNTKYIHTMAHITAEDETTLNEVMQLLEAQPVDTTSANPLVSLTNDDNIPAQREKLVVLVSTGKSKKAIGA